MIFYKQKPVESKGLGWGMVFISNGMVRNERLLYSSGWRFALWQ